MCGRSEAYLRVWGRLSAQAVRYGDCREVKSFMHRLSARGNGCVTKERLRALSGGLGGANGRMSFTRKELPHPRGRGSDCFKRCAKCLCLVFAKKMRVKMPCAKKRTRICAPVDVHLPRACPRRVRGACDHLLFTRGRLLPNFCLPTLGRRARRFTASCKARTRMPRPFFKKFIRKLGMLWNFLKRGVPSEGAIRRILP